MDTLKRNGLVCPRFEFSHDFDKVFFKVLFESLNGELVYSCCPSVFFDSFEGFSHKLDGYSPCEGVNLLLIVFDFHELVSPCKRLLDTSACIAPRVVP